MVFFLVVSLFYSLFFILLLPVFLFLIYPAGPSTASEAFRSDSLHVSGRRFMFVSCVHFCACMCVCACVCVRVCVCYVLSHFLYYVWESRARESVRGVGELLSCLFSGAIRTATSAALGYARGEICWMHALSPSVCVFITAVPITTLFETCRNGFGYGKNTREMDTRHGTLGDRACI